MDLISPDPGRWAARFDRHRWRIRLALPQARTEHIGSTAIDSICAKDVVDILVGEVDVTAAAQALLSAGYVIEGERPNHIWLCWPDPQQREAVVHVVIAEGDIWHQRLLFRDFLKRSPAEARAYEALKQRLAAQTDDWGEYTAQKAAFVARILQRAAES